jgi:hypothetical protein
VNQELKKKFELSNKFFKICEISDEYELIKVDEINEKILCFEFNDNGRNLLYCTTRAKMEKKIFGWARLFSAHPAPTL